MIRTLLPAVLAAGLLVGCSGGSDKRPEVTGKVTLNGTAITEGLVTFHGQDGQEQTGSIRPDGNYTVSDPPLGVCRISLRGVPGPEAPKGQSGAHAGAVPGMGPRPSQIPKRYESQANGLTHEVKPGTQTRDIELTP